MAVITKPVDHGQSMSAQATLATRDHHFQPFSLSLSHPSLNCLVLMPAKQLLYYPIGIHTQRTLQPLIPRF